MKCRTKLIQCDSMMYVCLRSGLEPGATLTEPTNIESQLTRPAKFTMRFINFTDLGALLSKLNLTCRLRV